MLFSLFFGAGNLIFPPYPGPERGQRARLPAMLGFLLTAVVLPVLGVIVVARFDGLDRLARQVGPPLCAGLYAADLPVHRAGTGHSARGLRAL